MKQRNDEAHPGESGYPRLPLERLAELERAIGTLDDPFQRVESLLETARILIDGDRVDEAWPPAREAFDIAALRREWEQAVQACEIMSRTNHAGAIRALAHGVWLGVTYPIDPDLSVAILLRLVDETPPQMDGAAVAAAAARYIVDLRAEGEQRAELRFFTERLLAAVASGHGIDSQERFDVWAERMQINDPPLVLARLAKMLDALADEGWWFDRDALRAGLPSE